MVAAANGLNTGWSLRLHQRPAPSAACGRGPGDRHGRAQQGVVSNPRRAVRGIKQSGLGREGSAVGIDEFLETKYIGIAMG